MVKVVLVIIFNNIKKTISRLTLLEKTIGGSCCWFFYCFKTSRVTLSVVGLSINEFLRADTLRVQI